MPDSILHFVVIVTKGKGWHCIGCWRLGPPQFTTGPCATGFSIQRDAGPRLPEHDSKSAVGRHSRKTLQSTGAGQVSCYWTFGQPCSGSCSWTDTCSRRYGRRKRGPTRSWVCFTDHTTAISKISVISMHRECTVPWRGSWTSISAVTTSGTTIQKNLESANRKEWSQQYRYQSEQENSRGIAGRNPAPCILRSETWGSAAIGSLESRSIGRVQPEPIWLVVGCSVSRAYFGR